MSEQTTYSFYRKVYRGVGIPDAESFARLALRADEEIRSFERRLRVTGTGDQRHRTVCAIADEMHTVETLAAAMIPLDEDGNALTAKISIGNVSTEGAVVNPAALGVEMSDRDRRRGYYRLLCKHMDVKRGAVMRCR